MHPLSPLSLVLCPVVICLHLQEEYVCLRLHIPSLPILARRKNSRLLLIPHLSTPYNPLLTIVNSNPFRQSKQFTIAMAPFILLATLASILALVIAQSGTGTGTGTGLPFPSATSGAPYPYPNGTLPVGPTATATSVPTGASYLVPRAALPLAAPYPIPGSSGLPGTGTGTGTGFALPTGYPKRMEMRGLKRVRGEEKKRAARWWW